MYIQLTNIDADTGILCTEAPMRTGPAIPNVKGFQFIFQNESDFPIASNPDGSLSVAPLLYGTCDDDADTTLVGVLKVLSEVEFNADKQAEHEARKPYLSWVGDINTMSWQSPVAYPQDGKQYYWDEPSVSWVEQTPVVQLP
jgi:hypothetical protein